MRLPKIKQKTKKQSLRTIVLTIDEEFNMNI
jgi:hypothetical protein